MRAAPNQQNQHDSAGDAGGTAPGAETVRLSINISPAVADTLKSVAKRNGWTNTEAVRRAISILAFVDSANRRGASLNIHEDGVLKEVLFV